MFGRGARPVVPSRICLIQHVDIKPHEVEVGHTRRLQLYHPPDSKQSWEAHELTLNMLRTLLPGSTMWDQHIRIAWEPPVIY